MGNKVFCNISISADGYVAGPGQLAENPFGDGPVEQLHAWVFDTPDEHKAEIDQGLFDGVPPLRLEPLAVRAASLTTHISYRFLH